MQGQRPDESLPVSGLPRQSRAELIGLAFGGFCFLAEWLLLSQFPDLPPTGVVLPVIVASLLAGITATFLTRQTAGVKDGIQAGVVSTLIGSSLLIVFVILRGLRSSELMEVELLALLSFPPAVSLGLIGAIIVTFVRNPSPLSPRSQVATQPASKRRNILFSIVLGISLLCYLAPLLFLVNPQPYLAERDPSQNLPATSSLPAATSIPWHYEKPQDFASISGRRIGLVDERQIPNVDANLPMAISPDGNRLAFFVTQHEQPTLQVLDLNSLQSVVTFSFPRPFAKMAWSPDSKRIFFVPQKETKLAGVIDLGSRRIMELPIPKNRHLPVNPAYWWTDEEVIFPQARQVLDLDTLQLIPLDESKHWKSLSQSEKSSWLEKPPNSWISPAKWTFDFIKRVQYYDVDPVEGWTGSYAYAVAISDNDIAFSRTVTPAKIYEGDHILAAVDGSKFIRVRGNTASVFYFGKVDSLATFTAKLPQIDAPESLLFFVCPAVVNPLNGKIVGADRDHVKAVARVLSQKDGVVTFWIDQEFASVSLRDIVADAHQWSGGIIQSKSTAWAPIEAAPASVAAPERKKTEPLDSLCKATFESPDGVAIVTGLYQKTSVAPAPATLASPAPQGRTDATTTTNTIQNFVRQHHKKSSANDIDGIVSDYADRIEYFSDGIVDREFIRKDTTSYHADHTVTEAVPGDIIVEPLSDQVYSVRYQLSFMRQGANNKWMRGVASVELEVAWTPDGYRITKQHAKILNKEQSP